jgi:hypothetical protein
MNLVKFNVSQFSRLVCVCFTPPWYYISRLPQQSENIWTVSLIIHFKLQIFFIVTL